jgi:hypothetical protein
MWRDYFKKSRVHDRLVAIETQVAAHRTLL